MKINKLCSCGHIHLTIPTQAIKVDKGTPMDGFWFNCKCENTLFVPTAKIINDDRAKQVEQYKS